MSDFIEKFRGLATHGSPKDKADAIRVIDEQIEMTMAKVDEASPHLVGHTAAYREMWTQKVETWRSYVSELEEVKRLLS